MKVCYVDETGFNDSEPCFVMTGIMVDAAKLHRTREEFADIFSDLQNLFSGNLQELKGSKILFGINCWRKVEAEKRKQIVGSLVEWLEKRRGLLMLAAIDRSKHSRLDFSQHPNCVSDIWLCGGLHIALQVQKANQSKKGNKGNTFLVFDDNKMKADAYAELLWDPPAWTDSYYHKKKKEDRLDQVIDTAFTIKSHHAGLVQVADLYAFLFRRYTELKDFGQAEEWCGEGDLIESFVQKLATRMPPKAVRWPAHPRCPCTTLFNQLAPPSLRTL